MTDYSELVKRLRERFVDVNEYSFDSDASEAADAITTLTARVAELEEALDEVLIPAPKQAKDGPCCYEQGEGGVWRKSLEGCTCGNRDDAQAAAQWADAMNLYARQSRARTVRNGDA